MNLFMMNSIIYYAENNITAVLSDLWWKLVYKTLDLINVAVADN